MKASLNKMIFDKLPFEIQVLWQASKIKRLQPKYLNEVSRLVSDVRNKMKLQNTDQLSMKQHEHGNSGGWGNYQIRLLDSAIYDDKKPNNADLGKLISVEIECVMPSKQAEKNVVKYIRSKGWGKFVTLKDDGSIKVKNTECECDADENGNTDDCECDTSSSAFGREIVVTFKYGDWTLLTSVCDALNRAGATVNDSCGLHVHFDMRHMESGRKMAVIAQRVGRAVPALKQMLPASRQNNKFCKTIINKLADSDSGDARYAFVNLKSYSKHKTLEIRGHSGTTDGKKIVNWIRILNSVMSKPSRMQISNVQELIAKVNFETDLIAYMLERQAKFRKTLPIVIDDVASDNRDAELMQNSFSIGTVSGTITATNFTIGTGLIETVVPLDTTVLANDEVYTLTQAFNGVVSLIRRDQVA